MGFIHSRLRLYLSVLPILSVIIFVTSATAQDVVGIGFAGFPFSWKCL